MKKLFITIFSFQMLVFFTGCKEKKMLVENEWIVESIKIRSDSNSGLMYPPPDFFANPFKGTLTLSLSNKDFVFTTEHIFILGEVKIGGYKIDFKVASGMEEVVSNESEFSKFCVNLLINDINHYQITNEKLRFTGANGEQINLIRKIKIY